MRLHCWPLARLMLGKLMYVAMSILTNVLKYVKLYNIK